jgi:plasmid stability protein
MGRNITLQLDEELLRRARVLAARRGRSVTALLRDELTRLVEEDAAFTAAREAAERRLRRGARLGGGPLPARQELHDRAALR